MFVDWFVQGLTIDSLIPAGAPPRKIRGEVVQNINAYYAIHNPAHLVKANSYVIAAPPPPPLTTTTTESGDMDTTTPQQHQEL